MLVNALDKQLRMEMQSPTLLALAGPNAGVRPAIDATFRGRAAPKDILARIARHVAEWTIRAGTDAE